MKDEQLEELKKQFDGLEPLDQWRWIFDYKNDGEIGLDNDSTDFAWNDDEDADFMLFFKSDIGDREGAKLLLITLGFKVDYV